MECKDLSQSINNPLDPSMRDLIPSRRVHAIAAAIALASLVVANAILTRLYAASNHPVDYRTGQTSFDADQIKGWYAAMTDAGTLDVYWYTQLFDFVFIAAVAATGLCAATFVGRLQPDGRMGSKMAYRAGTLLVLGAGFDATENMLSFVMLALPTSFPGWLATAYSAAATIKFVLIGLAMLALVISLIAWPLGALNRQLCARVGHLGC